MSNEIKFVFKEKKFDLENFKRILKKVAGNEFNEKDISINKSGNLDDPSYYSYDYNNKKEKIRISFSWYEKRRRLVIFVPNWENGSSYCMNVIKLIYPVLKCGGYGHETFAFDEESEHRTKEEIDKTRIWSVNLFTPKEVRKYGREKILSAPCETVEELEDGAMITMIRKNSFYCFFGEREKLRKHLNAK